jgi:hypothetical protein
LSRGSFGVIGRAAAAAAHFIANIVALFWRCRLSRTDVRGVLIRIPRGERNCCLRLLFWIPLNAVGWIKPPYSIFTWHGSRWKLTLVVFFPPSSL